MKQFRPKINKIKIAPSAYNASVVEFLDIDITPILILSSSYKCGYLSCAIIEHIIIYLSVISF